MWTAPDVAEVAARIAPYVWRTPLLAVEQLSRKGIPFYLKAECQQQTGSFKVRGAVNALSLLSDPQRKRGVVTASSGGHGKAVAYAAQLFDTQATIVLPQNPMPVKLQAILDYGAKVVLQPGTSADQLQKARELAKEQGLVFIHSFNTPEIFLGQGTAGLEIIQDLPDVDTIVVPIGGGGLLAGTLIAVKETNPRVRVIGVQPAGCAAVYQSWRQGRIVALDASNTIAEGLSCTKPEEPTFSLVQRYVDDVVIVQDEEILTAVASILMNGKLLVEPSGAAAAAAYLFEQFPVRPGKVVALATGGNIGLSLLRDILAKRGDHPLVNAVSGEAAQRA